MSVESELKLKIFVSIILTIISEIVIISLIVSILRLPLFLIGVFLGLLWLIQWLISPYLVARDAYEVTPIDPYYSWVYSIVKNVSRKSNIKTPRIFIVNEPFPNAFAYGNYVSGKRIGITKPLLSILTPEELEAVIGHEIGHIKHADVEIGMAIGLVPSIIGYLGMLLINTGLIFFLFIEDISDIIFAIILISLGSLMLAITFFIQIFVLWFNRLRESYADMYSVKILGKRAYYLATALAKIEIYMKNIRIDPFTGIIVTATPVKVTSNDPNLLLEEWLHKKISPFSDIFDTHPHPAKRVKMIFELLSLY
ncbi:zinc metalloprotease HtpX [Acidianus brierleyi]|uniref:Protease HtpX homolog n=1 Tax=Acidianus brierleyi TaxID=41673 RepID=A0A2U9IGV5_9CREN|nr:zinc metalloprotease HtpX [Acidianus brierleyi]AWR95205.1 M48 family metalloprotease [Acidianus brierleyi]